MHPDGREASSGGRQRQHKAQTLLEHRLELLPWFLSNGSQDLPGSS